MENTHQKSLLWKMHLCIYRRCISAHKVGKDFRTSPGNGQKCAYKKLHRTLEKQALGMEFLGIDILGDIWRSD